MRALSREILDDAMTAAECLIVSKRHCAAFDMYVLSESSLFVYPNKVVLKTCGTTKLLNGVPLLLKEAAAIGMVPRRVKYTRSTFLFPDEQPMGGDFDKETEFLEEHFGSLGPDGGNAFVLGSKLRGVQWHVYVADDDTANKPAHAETAEASDCSTQDVAGVDAVPVARPVVEPTVSLEVCMTHLNTEHSKHFIRDDTFVSSRRTTEESGIAGIFPTMDIDDYVFEPCGYSMNGMCGTEYSTIHITPEDGFSYCSVEHSNIPVSLRGPRGVRPTGVRRVQAWKVFPGGVHRRRARRRRGGAPRARHPRLPSPPGEPPGDRRLRRCHLLLHFRAYPRGEHRPSRGRGDSRRLSRQEDCGARLGLGQVRVRRGEAPDRKKMRANSPVISPVTPSICGGAGSTVADSGAKLVRDGSVNHLPALAGMATTPMTEFAGLVTLRPSLPTPAPWRT